MHYIFGYGEEPNKDKGWHVDEPTCQLLRVNIPLQTSDEYVMEWADKTYELEVGKVYLWNTRMPHRPTMKKKVETKQPRINIVLGLTLGCHSTGTPIIIQQNQYFGKPVNEIVKEKIICKMNITREKVFTDLVCVEKLGKLSAEEQLKLAETIGEVEKPDLNNERHKELFDKWGGVLVL